MTRCQRALPASACLGEEWEAIGHLRGSGGGEPAAPSLRAPESATKDSSQVKSHEDPSPSPLQCRTELGRGPRTCSTFSTLGLSPRPCLDRTIWGAEQHSRDSPLPALGISLLLMQPLLPVSAGYQGSFHSIHNCFPYGDCYRTTEAAASGNGPSGESHSFNPLRPNGYHSLSAPLPTTGKPHVGTSPRACQGPTVCWVLCARYPEALGQPCEAESSPLQRGT